MKPNLLPDYGTISKISVIDPSGAVVRQWLNLMTNAGGVIDLNYTLAKQVPEGKWKIQAVKDNFKYDKTFRVIEYCESLYCLFF